MSTPEKTDASPAIGVTTIGADNVVEIHGPNTGLEVQEGELTAESTTAVEVQEHTTTTESDPGDEVQHIASMPDSGAVLTINPKKRRAETLSGGENPDSAITIDSDTDADADSDSDAEETANINTSNAAFNPKRRKTVAGSYERTTTALTTVNPNTAAIACMLSLQNRREIVRLQAEMALLKSENVAMRAENVAMKAQLSTKASDETCTDIAEVLGETVGQVTKLEEDVAKLKEEMADLKVNEKIIRAVTSREMDVVRDGFQHGFEALKAEHTKDIRELKKQIRKLDSLVKGLCFERQFGVAGRTKH